MLAKQDPMAAASALNLGSGDVKRLKVESEPFDTIGAHEMATLDGTMEVRHSQWLVVLARAIRNELQAAST